MRDPTPATPVDWVLLCTKSHRTQSAAPWLACLCTTHTRVAVLQNGIRLADRPFEVEALTGAIVAAGERHGLPTPLNTMALTRLRTISDAQAPDATA
jgi:ketopantoate reductase